ncbi:MAG TPA: hypothetical protein VFN67_25320 [Polyangiales bacterium]|nr:hypothetical protein [Polyangiales bacterium]
MARSSFARALGFAVLAAAITVPVMIMGAFSLGYEGALLAYMLLLTPISLFVTAPDVRAGLRAGLVTGVVALILLCSVVRLESALLGALVTLAIGRSLLTGPRPLARVLFFEIALGALAFGAFAAFRDQRLIGDALAVWGFWLVQSGFALIAHSAAVREQIAVDAFDAARNAAERLMHGH